MFATPAMDPESVHGRTSRAHVFGDLLCSKCRSKKKKVRVGSSALHLEETVKNKQVRFILLTIDMCSWNARGAD